MKKQQTPYRKSIAILLLITPQIRKQFNKTRLTIGSDLSNGTRKLYKKLQRINVSALAVIAADAYAEADGKDDTVNEKWVLGLLAAYGVVTGYVYNNEADRKRDRLFEALSAINTESVDAEAKTRQIFTRANSLWLKQTEQATIDIVDEARITAFKENGVTYVRWVSEHDSRRCKECADLDGTVYPIDEIPEKAHINCRCWLEAVK